MLEPIQSYAGFTIGPICDVMRHGRKTRELWFGSYFFSWYMESLISRLISPDIHFLTPHIDAEAGPDGQKKLLVNRSLTGKYHDRFVVKAAVDADTLFERIQTENNQTLDGFVEMIEALREQAERQGGKRIDGNRESTAAILGGYLQPRFFVMEDEQYQRIMAEGGGPPNPVKAADRILNNMERERTFTPGRSAHTCVRCKTLPGIVMAVENVRDEGAATPRPVHRTLCPICLAKYRCHLSGPLLDKVFPRNGGDPQKVDDPLRRRRFFEQTDRGRRLAYPSIQEISALEIFERNEAPLKEKLDDKRKLDRDAELSFEEIREALPKEVKDTVKPFHKYIAVVQADGDNLGRLAARIDNPSRLSERLFRFAEKAEGLIWEHGGLPIFIGGDDILAFMPVFYKEQTVIDFVAEAARVYREVLGHSDGGKGTDGDPPSISFGVNIAYYKFPLATARRDAADLLFGTAKSVKDSMALRLTKHAGSFMECRLKIGAAEFEQVRNLLRWTLAEARPGKDGELIDFRLPGGLRYNLGRFEPLLAAIPNRDRLKAFFNNQFNEGAHIPFDAGLNAVYELIAHFLYERNPNGSSADHGPYRKEAVETAMAVLKLVRFFTEKEVE